MIVTPSELVMLYHTTVMEMFASLCPHSSASVIKIQIEFRLVSPQNINIQQLYDIWQTQYIFDGMRSRAVAQQVIPQIWVCSWQFGQRSCNHMSVQSPY